MFDCVIFFGFHYRQKYVPEDRRGERGQYWGIDFRKSIENYANLFSKILGNPIKFYGSTYSSDLEIELMKAYPFEEINIEDYKKNENNNFPKGRNNHLKKGVKLAMESGLDFERVIITRFDLLFDSKISSEEFDFSKLNISSRLEKNRFICDNFYLFPGSMIHNVYDCFKSLDYKPHEIEPKLVEKCGNLHLVRNENTLVSKLSFYDLVRT